MNDLVIMKNQQAVTTSLQVSEVFGKRHDHILRDISQMKQDVPNFGGMFLEGVEPDSYGRDRKVVYMNRDGFTLLAMGFTGKKALEFKIRYIEAFNRMESQIKLDTTKLSPELQMFKELFDSMAKQELKTNRIDHKLDNISEIVGTSTMDWRQGTTRLIQRIAQYQGGGDAYKDVRNEIYAEVDKRAGVSLKTRLTNKRRRMADEGVSKSKRNKLNKVDVIQDDKKLIEIYMAIVKEYAIKNHVWEKDY
ncbi:phage regulatory protein [Pediococcus acidilactici]|uniref:Rha family transcriptional regulator n=1 Tax=Pediococcus acidilactici TaxID=1254 RepID=UPI0013221E2A|nr:Rha family transcriptional regulator [Pediococcus acidilactici]KAF0468799.1 phage regulatory protein [Pediococcus acidilactici]KAF0539785.1 phage regulatory protein [Pediococcus acidilactici]